MSRHSVADGLLYGRYYLRVGGNQDGPTDSVLVRVGDLNEPPDDLLERHARFPLSWCESPLTGASIQLASETANA